MEAGGISLTPNVDYTLGISTGLDVSARVQEQQLNVAVQATKDWIEEHPYNPVVVAPQVAAAAPQLMEEPNVIVAGPGEVLPSFETIPAILKAESQGGGSMAFDLSRLAQGAVSGLAMGGLPGMAMGAAGGLLSALNPAAGIAVSGRGGLQGAQVIATGHRMILLQTATGRRVLVRRAPRIQRRFRGGRSTSMDKMMQLAMIKAISK